VKYQRTVLRRNTRVLLRNRDRHDSSDYGEESLVINNESSVKIRDAHDEL